MHPNDNKSVATPYDDVFRTLVVDLKELLPAVINEIFGEHYTGREEIVFSMNEHFLNAQDGIQDKVITDSSFAIIGKQKKKYLFECQSTPDQTMLIRIFEYSTQIALDEGELIGNRLCVSIPNSAILFLRTNRNTPDEMFIEMNTPGGDIIYPVKVMKSQHYSVDDIFEKNLLFLIPFYIFIYDKKFNKILADKQMLEKFKTEYRRIAQKLYALSEEEKISVYTRKTLVEMTQKVVDNLALNYEIIRNEVKEIMGGRVLDYEAKRILNQGISQGVNEMIFRMHEDGLTDERIAKIAQVDVKYVQEVLASFSTSA